MRHSKTRLTCDHFVFASGAPVLPIITKIINIYGIFMYSVYVWYIYVDLNLQLTM